MDNRATSRIENGKNEFSFRSRDADARRAAVLSVRKSSSFWQTAIAKEGICKGPENY